ncbi:MAG: hypothetical protein HY077_18000 [Elusimicrobia bacterium]|nr:hypothetical protein [Elusimicrobiota bacterium]
MLLAAAVIVCALPAASREDAPTATLPSETDERISDFNDPHLSWPPVGKPRGELFVFLPGTGGKPGKAKNMLICETAASLGYHAVSLMYPDKWASQKTVSQSSDPDAYLKFRLAIIQGGRIKARKTISPADSIANRLEKLLKHLASSESGRGWDQFIDENGGVIWKKVAVSGSSQGGGHAYIIGKYHEVARVIMFNSPKDYSFHFKRPAKGFDAETQTPLNRFFAFNHVKDNGNGCNHEQQKEILRQMGLDGLGVADVDKAKPDFGHARVLYTDMEVASKRYHGSVLKPECKCQAVWKYLLTEASS